MAENYSTNGLLRQIAEAGDTSADAWDGEAPDASAISILKAIYMQNETIIAHLAAIETNTAA